jgi:hypothetical protein
MISSRFNYTNSLSNLLYTKSTIKINNTIKWKTLRKYHYW